MPLPSTYTLVPLRGKFVDLEGNPVAGSVTFTPTVIALTVSGEKVTVIGKPLVVWLDSTGLLSTHLPATNDPDVLPTGFVYQVSEKFNGLTGRSYTVAIPIEASPAGLDLSDVVPPEVPTDPYLFTVLLIDGGIPSSTYSITTDGGTP